MGYPFTALEGIDEKDVGVLAISPDPNKQQVKLQMEAKSLELMLTYHRKLARESGVFGHRADRPPGRPGRPGQAGSVQHERDVDHFEKYA